MKCFLLTIKEETVFLDPCCALERVSIAYASKG